MFVSIYSMFTDSSSKENPIDVTTFRQDILNKDKANDIKSVLIEPRGKDDAKYIITYGSTETKGIVNAEFPGKLTDELFNAKIKYNVKSKDESSIWPQVLV